jgi:Fibronectin-attachment protein (FAP)
MHHPDATPHHRKGLSTTLAIAALTGATAVALTLPVANADPTTPPPPPPPAGNTFMQEPPPPADPNAPPPPPADLNASAPPPADPNAPPAPPPADPNAPPAPPPEPGRVDNAAGGFSYVVPAGWKVADATQLSYGQALLNKIPAEANQPNGQAAQPPSDTSVLLGRLDLKLFAGAETDNTKAAQRLASDMGEFFMPFPGTRINQETVPLNAGGMSGVASYYEVKFTDTTKPNGQIWAGVVGAPTPPGTPRGQRTPERWFVVWLGTANNPVPKGEAVTLAQSIRPWTPPPPPPPDPNAPPPPAGGTNVPGQSPNVGVPVPVDPNSVPPGMLPPS